MADPDEVATIEAESKKEVAAIEAVQKMDAESASSFMTTLDKLQEFKRYTLALIFLIILLTVVIEYGVFSLYMAYKNQPEIANENFRWIITVISGTVGIIIGFYFGSNQGTNTG